MRSGPAFALAALIPAALGGAPVSAGRTLLLPICSGNGAVRMAQVPLDEPRLPGSDPAGCCVKGCHASGSRKKADGKPEPQA